MSLRLSGVSKHYEAHPRSGAQHIAALTEIDLEAGEGELVAVVGPSGSGKTTLLRCVAGLETPDRGRIEVAGRDVTDLPPGDRDIAMVFQEYALYPHLSVEGNVSFGLRARKVDPSEIGRRVSVALEVLGLDGVEARSPQELSGGERQRVALARAIVREPRAFLLDEPLSNLDAELRARARAEIKGLQRRLDTTTLYVTHDQVEALTLGDRVAVLREGRLEQVDRPMVVYEHPASAFVARFLGSPPMNLFPLSALGEERSGRVGGVRPEHMTIVSPSEGKLSGTVTLIEPIGSGSIVHIDVGGTPVLVRTDWRAAPVPEVEVGVTFDAKDLYRFESMDGPVVG